jgi:hypothetical protein
MTTQLAAAHTYLDRGISILPLQSQSKRPFGAWKLLQQSRMGSNAADNWWSGRIQPTPGLGIITGEISGGLSVLDIEPEHVDHVLRSVTLPDTPVVHTARGGLHVYCHGATRNRKLTLDDRIVGDVRGNGGYVVAPPTQINSGVYAWHGPTDWNVGELAELPTWAAVPEIVTTTRPPLVSFRSDPSLSRLPSKVLRAMDNPQPRRSLSELDYWVVMECIWQGAEFEDIAEWFDHFPIGANVERHRTEKGNPHYLEQTYASAYQAVERAVERAVTVKCFQVRSIGGSFGALAARRRVLIEAHKLRDGQLHPYTIPMILGAPRDGELAGEWTAFCRAFGLRDPVRDPICPRGLARAVFHQGRIIRFVDPEVWQ